MTFYKPEPLSRGSLYYHLSCTHTTIVEPCAVHSEKTGKTITNHPFRNGLSNLFLMIWGMVYYNILSLLLPTLSQILPTISSHLNYIYQWCTKTTLADEICRSLSTTTVFSWKPLEPPGLQQTPACSTWTTWTCYIYIYICLHIDIVVSHCQHVWNIAHKLPTLDTMEKKVFIAIKTMCFTRLNLSQNCSG